MQQLTRAERYDDRQDPSDCGQPDERAAQPVQIDLQPGEEEQEGKADQGQD